MWYKPSPKSSSPTLSHGLCSLFCNTFVHFHHEDHRNHFHWFPPSHLCLCDTQTSGVFYSPTPSSGVSGPTTRSWTWWLQSSPISGYTSFDGRQHWQGRVHDWIKADRVSWLWWQEEQHHRGVRRRDQNCELSRQSTCNYWIPNRSTSWSEGQRSVRFPLYVMSFSILMSTATITGDLKIIGTTLIPGTLWLETFNERKWGELKLGLETGGT